MGQAFSQEGEIVKTLTRDTPEEIGKELSEFLKKNKITHFTVGKIPEKGNVVEINGLKYDVTDVDNALGKVFLKIKGNS